MTQSLIEFRARVAASRAADARPKLTADALEALLDEIERLRGALRRIEAMSSPLPVRREGNIVSHGRVESGSLERAAEIAREALGGN